MARIPLLDFTDREIARVFMARDVAEAQQVESLLTTDGIDYAIEVESFVIPPFRIERTGVAFYVLAEQADASRELCTRDGLHSGIVEEDVETPVDSGQNQSVSGRESAMTTVRHGCLISFIALFVILTGLLCAALWMQN